jgi:hypothetical protein
VWRPHQDGGRERGYGRSLAAAARDGSAARLFPALARVPGQRRDADSRHRRRRTLTIEAYAERYLDDYRERQKDSAYVTASSRLAPFRREFGHLPLEDGALDRRAASDWAREHRSCVPAVVALFKGTATTVHSPRSTAISTLGRMWSRCG